MFLANINNKLQEPNVEPAGEIDDDHKMFCKYINEIKTTTHEFRRDLRHIVNTNATVSTGEEKNTPGRSMLVKIMVRHLITLIEHRVDSVLFFPGQVSKR